MACRAPSKGGVLYLTAYTDLAVTPTVLGSDAVLAENIQLAERGDGRVDRTDAESIEPGGIDPYIGSYGETISFDIPVYIPGVGDVTTAHYVSKILRACGYRESIDDGVAEWWRSVRTCENIATGLRPLLVTWMQVDGTAHQWTRCVGTVSIASDNAGVPVMLSVELHGDPATVVATQDGVPTPAPVYVAQGVPLSARNATLSFGAAVAPRALYSVEFSDGISAEDQPSQLAARGLDTPLIYQTDSARMTLQTVVTATHGVEMWSAFYSQAPDTLVYSVSGQAPSPIFEIEAGRAFAGRPDLGEQGAARAMTVEWLLKPDRSETDPEARAPAIIRLMEPEEPS